MILVDVLKVLYIQSITILNEFILATNYIHVKIYITSTRTHTNLLHNSFDVLM